MAMTEIQLARHEAGAIQVSETGFTMQGLAEVFVQSGYFKDVRAASQAMVKVLYGKELGLSPIQSMLAIHMVDGKPELAAAAMGALVKRSRRYDYRVTEHSAEACEIAFFEIQPDGQREPIGTSRFDDEDMKRAQLNRAGSNHEKYPKAMKFARAMSQGVKWFCLDAIGGIPVYSEGELRDAGVGRGELVDVTPEAEAPDEYMPRETVAVLPAPITPPIAPAAPPAPDLTVPLTASIDQAREKKAAKRKESALKAPPAPAPAPAPAPDPPSEEAAVDLLCVECGAPLGDEPMLQRGSDWLHARCVTRPEPAVAAPAPEAEVEFVLHGNRYVTKGMTAEQMEKSFTLTTQIDKTKGKGTSKAMLAKMLGLPVDDARVTRLNLTEDKAGEFLKRMEAALVHGPAEQTVLT